jgi:hypothetical protein
MKMRNDPNIDQIFVDLRAVISEWRELMRAETMADIATLAELRASIQGDIATFVRMRDELHSAASRLQKPDLRIVKDG